MIRDIDIWLAASLTLRRYGAKALEECAAGADELLPRTITWKRSF